jgi:hypothetical protein
MHDWIALLLRGSLPYRASLEQAFRNFTVPHLIRIITKAADNHISVDDTEPKSFT